MVNANHLYTLSASSNEGKGGNEEKNSGEWSLKRGAKNWVEGKSLYDIICSTYYEWVYIYMSSSKYRVGFESLLSRYPSQPSDDGMNLNSI